MASITIPFVIELAKILNRSPFGWAIFTLWLAFTSIILAVLAEEIEVTIYCVKCGKIISTPTTPIEIEVGQRCPYCGAKWAALRDF